MLEKNVNVMNGFLWRVKQGGEYILWLNFGSLELFENVNGRVFVYHFDKRTEKRTIPTRMY